MLKPDNPEAEPVTAHSVWDLIKKTASSWNDVNAPRLGAALAFYTMLSTAPLLVLSIAIAGLVFGRQAAQGQIVTQLVSVVGRTGALAIQQLIENASKPGVGYTAAGIGFLVLLWGASSVFGELRDSLNLVWGVKTPGGSGVMGFVRYRFVAFATVLGTGFLLLVSLLLSAALVATGKFLGGALPLPGWLLAFFNLIFSFVSITILFALIYKFVPDLYIEWRDVWIGAAVTSALFSLGKYLIGLYLGEASIGSTYGAAGTLVVFLIWVYWSAQIFFLGAEFTHSFAERHGSRAGSERHREKPPADVIAERVQRRRA
jgi:membrane protein